MNLDGCTPYQREIVTTLDAPLAVSAGAGSGKTFTLTQRIAYAFSEESGPYLTDIEQVMAITFTKKAAGELRSRIKSLLIQEGRVDQALKVDDAWITTIHGMCSRMLKEHALELGLDPGFTVLEGADQELIECQAVDSVIGFVRAAEDGNPRIDQIKRLITDYDLYPTGFNGWGLVPAAVSLFEKCQSLPQGLGSIKIEWPQDPSRMMMQLLAAAQGARAYASIWEQGKMGKRQADCIKMLDEGIASVNAYLAAGHVGDFMSADFDAQAYANAFYSFQPIHGQLAGKDESGTLAGFNELYASLSREVEQSRAWLSSQAFKDFAQLIGDKYAELKGPGRLDNTDLLVKAAEALESNEQMAAAYRDQFKLIMVDEFQDTDRTQLGIIGRLAQPDYSNICTVGDVQQSIYAFRGADVTVFNDFKLMLRNYFPDTAKLCTLPDNFRSHKQVLDVVEAVFKQPSAFGRDFLHLEAKGKVNAQPDPVFEGDEAPARIKVFVGTKVKNCSIRNQAAREVADHFAALREAGAQPRDMVLLLGGLTQADVYSEALRERGFECIIAGGSVFSKANEVKLVCSLLRVGANSLDAESLFSVLTSPLFNLSDDAVLALRKYRKDIARAFNDQRFWEKDDSPFAALSEGDRKSLSFARSCLDRMQFRIRGKGPSAAIRALLDESGWMLRLDSEGAHGQDVAGNLHKALRKLEDAERKATGISSLAQSFSEQLEASKDSPGSLESASSNFVSIMTIHASKGLQFPHVALAEVREKPGSADNLCTARIDDRLYMSMGPAQDYMNDAVIKSLKKRLAASEEDDDGLTAADRVVRARTIGEARGALERLASESELQEHRRLLYVGMTRAVKSLLICVSACTTGKPDQEQVPGIPEDMHGALGWEPEAFGQVQQIDYEGCMSPALVLVKEVEKPADPQDDPAAWETPALDVPARMLQERLEWPLPFDNKAVRPERDVFSYSSVKGGAESGPDGLEKLFGSDFDRINGNSSLDAPEGENDCAMDSWIRVSDQESIAVEMGSAFHRLAQRAIEEAAQRGGGIQRPAEAAIKAQIVHYGLSRSHQERLIQAVRRWFGSGVAQVFSQHETLRAEVPFLIDCARTGRGSGPFLEGEIDGLAYDGQPGSGNVAYLIDYKTGGHPGESEEELRAKHLLQAQCYAYALLSEGFSQVDALFVRVEQPDAQDPREPQTVRYLFEADQREELRQAILRCYDSRENIG